MNGYFRAAMSLVLWIVLAGPALALGTESLGNNPIPAGGNLSKEATELVNLKSRVYWREVNGDYQFFFRGNTEALNDALRKFAAIPGEVHELILLPGEGETHTFDNTRVLCTWHFHEPGGFYAAFARREKETHVMTRHPTMRVYIAHASRKADEKAIKRWIGDLDSERFAVRDAAVKELAKLGNAAGAEFRRVLDGKPSAEVRRQVEMLLERLEGIDLARLQIPAGVTVLQIKDLLDRYRAGLKSAEAEIRGHACGGLGELAGHTEEAIPLLIEALKTDKHEYVR